MAECPFEVEGNRISTPFADVILEKGRIVSYKTKGGLEVVSDGDMPLNTFYFGEDIPNIWDNWDIDYDQVQKMNPIPECISSEVVSIGALQLRVRVKYQFGDSKLSQDIIFYADNPRIDFESVVDWNSPHSLLKVGFKVNVLASEARFETQFGNIKRPTHENYPTDKTQFEVCNHKWTDLSDTRFGIRPSVCNIEMSKYLSTVYTFPNKRIMWKNICLIPRKLCCEKILNTTAI